MRHTGSNAVLGIALDEGGCIVAEVANGRNGESPRCARIAYPAGTSLQNASALGKVLASALKSHGISTRTAVIGLPSRWLVTRRKQLPPMKADMAASTLRLSAEAEFSSEPKDLVVDYAGETSPSVGSTVLVVGTARERIDACIAFARAAGLHLRSITSTGLSLAEAAGVGDVIVLSVAGASGELAARQSGAPAQIRHITLANMDRPQIASTLLAELRRACAGVIAEGNKPSIVLWADPSLSLEEDVSRQLGVTMSRGRLPMKAAQEAFASAFVLASDAPKPGGIDFLHSRLAPVTPKSNRKAVIWGIAVAAALLLAIGIAAWDLHQQQAELEQVRSHLSTIAPDVKKAETAVGRLDAARGWVPSKPRYLACMADLTNLFPDEGSIWASTVSLRSDMSGQVLGKASSEQQVLALYDRLKDSKRFAELKLPEMRDAGRNSHEIAFSISFLYRAE